MNLNRKLEIMNADMKVAASNFGLLYNHEYPGRFLVQGVNEGGTHALQLYGITARSEGSKNRVFSVDGTRLFTEMADTAKSTGDPALIYYNAMREVGNGYIVSNGNQTDAVVRHHEDIPGCSDLLASLENFSYEPDAPNNTSRITGACWIEAEKPRFEFSLISKSDTEVPVREHHYHEYAGIPAGYGRGIMTYSDDGNPLPAFTDRPWLLPMKGSPCEIIISYWNALPPDKRVALALKTIELSTGSSEIIVKNALEKV